MRFSEKFGKVEREAHDISDHVVDWSRQYGGYCSMKIVVIECHVHVGLKRVSQKDG